VNGVFRDLSGYGIVSAEGEVSGTLVVVAASIDTKNTRRDTHLRSADFLDSAGNPDITFTADAVRLSGERVTVMGALAVRGRTLPLSFDAAVSVHGDGEILLDGQVQINRADFGLTWNSMGMAGMNNTITIHAVFTRQ
jgi:polyisoprenoid-binding protein YceI